jgi:hypothetical protein
MHYIVNDFKSILVEKDGNFHIYDNQNELNICRWKEIPHFYIPSTFSNNNPSEGEHEHQKEVWIIL